MVHKPIAIMILPLAVAGILMLTILAATGNAQESNNTGNTQQQPGNSFTFSPQTEESNSTGNAQESNNPEMHRRVTIPEMHRRVTIPEMHRRVTIPEMHRRVTIPEMHRRVTIPEMHRRVTIPEIHNNSRVTVLKMLTVTHAIMIYTLEARISPTWCWPCTTASALPLEFRRSCGATSSRPTPSLMPNIC